MYRNTRALELRYLIALTAVGREGSFSLAAESLDYTQSAISHQIRQLEEVAGQKLVERPGGPNPVSLTSAGRILVTHGEAILARLDSARADLEALSDEGAGELRIGYYQSLGAQFLPEILSAFTMAWPKMSIKLTEAEDDLALLKKVERGELDVIYIVYPMISGPFSHCELFDDPYVAVVLENCDLGLDGMPINPRELIQYPIITYAQMRPVHSVAHRLGIPEISDHFVLRSNNNATILGLVRAGIGVALVSRLSVGSAAEGLRVVRLHRVQPRVVGLAWHRERRQMPALNAFVRMTQQHAKQYHVENSR